MRPLDGVRVLDLSQLFAGPSSAVYLADQGADVVKVEPLVGDIGRFITSAPPHRGGECRSYLAVGRNKRGIALDLTRDEGRAVLHRLVRQFDVLVTNLRPGAGASIGIDYETLRAINPRLIYVQVTAYGSEGPYAKRPGYDLILQGLTGILSRRRMPDGTPIPAPIWVADCSVPAMMAYGVALALLMRERTGEGQRVDTSLLMASVVMQELDAVKMASDSEGGDSHDYSRQAMYAPYLCSDGKWIVIVVTNDQQWSLLCDALELDHLAHEPRFDSAYKRALESTTLHEILSGVFETQPREHWEGVLAGHGVPSGPMLLREEIYDYEQFRANGVFVDIEDDWASRTTMHAAPVRLSAADPPTYRRAPRLGEHSREVLIEAGFAEGEVEDLERRGIVGAHKLEA